MVLGQEPVGLFQETDLEAFPHLAAPPPPPQLSSGAGASFKGLQC